MTAEPGGSTAAEVEQAIRAAEELMDREGLRGGAEVAEPVGPEATCAAVERLGRLFVELPGPHRMTGGRLLGGSGEAHARRRGDSGRCATEPGCASDASTVFLLFVAFRLGSSSLGRRPELSCPPSGSDRDRSITVVSPAWLNHKATDRVLPVEVAGHGVDNGQVDHGFGSGRERLASAEETPVEHQPSVGPLDRLTLWGRGAARQCQECGERFPGRCRRRLRA